MSLGLGFTCISLSHHRETQNGTEPDTETEHHTPGRGTIFSTCELHKDIGFRHQATLLPSRARHDGRWAPPGGHRGPPPARTRL